jgi:hypothetical protein
VAVAFDPKGRLLATGNTDGAVRLWDARNGKLLLELTGHRGAVTAVAFTAKGDRLVSISADTTALVWDVHGVRTEEKRLPPLHLKDAELERAWNDIAEGDSATAAAAVQTLARAPDQVVPMLRERVTPPDEARLAQWIKQLDDDDFPTRKNAKRKLAQAGKFAEPALRNALKNNPSVEVAARIKELLEPLTETGLSPEQKRLIRSLEVLEMIDGKDARAVLKLVADGPKDLDVTQQAKAALERMIKRDAEKD